MSGTFFLPSLIESQRARAQSDTEGTEGDSHIRGNRNSDSFSDLPEHPYCLQADGMVLSQSHRMVAWEKAELQVPVPALSLPIAVTLGLFSLSGLGLFIQKQDR